MLHAFEKKTALFILVILGTVLLTMLTFKSIRKSPLNNKLLLSIHVLRIPVELVLFQLYLQYKIPRSMTFKGLNLDILMGISALILLIYTHLSGKRINRKFFIAWNILGIGFLLFIVGLAILSSPLAIQQFAFDQPNIAVLVFPYCLLPAAVVPGVLLAHLLLLRQEKH